MEAQLRNSNTPVPYSSEHGAVGGTSSGLGFPKYLEILDDSTDPAPQFFHHPHPHPHPAHGGLCPDINDGYEIPLPRKPPRNPRALPPSRFSISSGDEITLGLPSPPPYWNTGREREREETEFLRRGSPNYHQHPSSETHFFKVPSNYHPPRKATVGSSESSETESHFRNLLPSSTSEDFEGEDVPSEELADDVLPHPQALHLESSSNSTSSTEPDLFYESGPCRSNLNSNYPRFPRESYSSSPNILRHHDSAPSTLSKGLPPSSSADSDYSRRQRQYHPYYNSNRPCVKAANSG